MDHVSSYRVYLRVFHPTISAGKVVESINLPVWFARSVGDEKPVSRTGGNGFYKETNVSFYLSEGVVNFESKELEVFLKEKFSELPLEFITQLGQTGGTVYFSIGVYSSENIMIDLLPSFLQEIAAVGMGMRLDFYGGPD